MVSLETSRRL
jgi:hypothetical protein